VGLEAQRFERGNRVGDYRVSAPSSQLFFQIFGHRFPDLLFRIFSRRNYISSARPFSQIDGTAMVAAKGKVDIAALDNFLADRAAKLQ
jgi:hypothetical protein